MTMLPKLRIASELHAAPGWVPIVADSNTKAAHQTDVLLWISPAPGSGDTARLVVDVLNASPLPSPTRGSGNRD